MKSNLKPFESLTAADLMSRELVLIPEEMSLAGAARRLSQARVSGAPVVDAEGRCVGVLSSADFVRWADAENTHAVRSPARAMLFHSSWQLTAAGEVPRDRVTSYMTPDPVTAGPAMGIIELARRMIDADVHRVVVVDPDGRPIGLVSGTDVLAAVAYLEEPLAYAVR
jgi:CBS-domain-containing membrane protein